MDVLDIDSTLKELDDLDAELFGDTLKKASPVKPQESDVSSSKHRNSQSSVDDFDDDIDDLLSDDGPTPLRSSGSKSAPSVKAKETTSDADYKLKNDPSFPGHSFASPEHVVSKDSPKHYQMVNKDSNKVTDVISKDYDLGSSDFFQGTISNDRKTSTFQSNSQSPSKRSEKDRDLDFLPKKSDFPDELGSTPPIISATSKNSPYENETRDAKMKLNETKGKKDDVNFDDSELLDDLDFGDIKPQKVKQRQRSNSIEKSRSFMDDLFGGPKNEPRLSTNKQQDFVLNEKYKASDTKVKSEELEFGGYVPSSVVSSGPVSRRKSVKFDDDALSHKSSTPVKKQGSLNKEDNFLDSLLSSKRRISTDAETSKLAESLGLDDSGYHSVKPKNSQPSIDKRHTENSKLDSMSSNKEVDSLYDDTPGVSKVKNKNLDWLGFSKEGEKKEQQRLPRERSLDFLDGPKLANKGKSQTERRSSGADWLGISTSKQRENRSDAFKVTDKKNDMTVAPHSHEKIANQPFNENMIKSVAPGFQIKSGEEENLASVKSPVMGSVERNLITSNVEELHMQQLETTPGYSTIASGQSAPPPYQGSFPQIIHQSLNSQNLPVQQLPSNGSQNEYLALQAMINSLQLEKDQLMKSIDSMKLNHAEELKTISSSQKTQKEVAEEFSKNQEERLKEEYKAQIHNLKSQLESLTSEKREVVENNRQRLIELEKEYNGEIQRLKDLHSQAITAMKLDHEEALSRLKKLKDQEVEAISSSQVYARSLQHLTEQLEARTAELGSLQIKVDGRHQIAIKERQALLDIKDKELNDFKKRLERQLEESDEERSRLQQLVLRLESRIQLQAKEGEEENWKIQQTKAKLDVQKKIFDEEQNQSLQQMEREKEKLRISQETLLNEQKTILMQLAQERQQLSSEKMELELFSKKIKEEEAKLASTRMRVEANIDTHQRSVLKEKENLHAERVRHMQETERLHMERGGLDKQYADLQSEMEKLNDSKIVLQRKLQELEENNRNAKFLKEEAKLALTSSNRAERENQIQRDSFSQKLMALREKEAQVLLEKKVLEREKMLLEKKRNSFLCVNCNLSLSNPFNALTSDVTMTRMPSAHPFASIGVLSGITNSCNTDQNLMWWYVTAQKDKEFLVNEEEFLQSLKEPSKRKQKLY